jgi:hypothetical protein
MPIPGDIEKINAMFERFGARRPEEWIAEEYSMSVSQLHRFLFLKQAWLRIVADDDTSWIRHEVAGANSTPKGLYSGIGLALSRCLEKGVDPQDLTDIVRGMQVSMLFSLCYMLEDPGFADRELDGIGWCLVEADENGRPTPRRIPALHESVLETDPTGRRMRPRET